jgi:hypothetical protein
MASWIDCPYCPSRTFIARHRWSIKSRASGDSHWRFSRCRVRFAALVSSFRGQGRIPFLAVAPSPSPTECSSHLQVPDLLGYRRQQLLWRAFDSCAALNSSTRSSNSELIGMIPNSPTGRCSPNESMIRVLVTGARVTTSVSKIPRAHDVNANYLDGGSSVIRPSAILSEGLTENRLQNGRLLIRLLQTRRFPHSLSRTPEHNCLQLPVGGH